MLLNNKKHTYVNEKHNVCIKKEGGLPRELAFISIQVVIFDQLKHSVHTFILLYKKRMGTVTSIPIYSMLLRSLC